MLLTLLLGAWAYLAHDHAHSIKQGHAELAQLPVYAYVADTTRVSIILDGLAEIPAILSVEYETGFQAALELIGSYDLQLTDNMIADYDFPDLITIYFEPSAGAIEAKAAVMKLLYSHLDEYDVDSQSAAFDKVVTQLEGLALRQLIFSIFISILMFLIYIFSRISYELSVLIKKKYKLDNVVDILRHKKSLAAHHWILLIFPVGLVSGGYFGGAYLQLWDNIAAGWTFILMALVSLIATFFNYLSLRSFEHDAVLDAVDLVPSKPEKLEETDA